MIEIDPHAGPENTCDTCDPDSEQPLCLCFVDIDRDEAYHMALKAPPMLFG